MEATTSGAAWTHDFRIGCDVGGTFTDIAVVGRDGGLTTAKAPTTVTDGGIGGVMEALAVAAHELSLGDVGDLLGRAGVFVHATTRGLNAVLQGRGTRTALLVTEGHRELLVLREGGRRIGQPYAPYPEPYVPRSLTFEVRERVGAEGQVIAPLDVEAARQTLRRVRDAGVEALAVCLLWSVLNPAHELRLAELVAEVLPELPYSLSHRVNPILREFRRASATALDASLKPLMRPHFTALGARLAEAGFRGRIFCATSAGGMLPLGEAAAAPVHTVHSGPSVAPVAAARFAGVEGVTAREDVLVVDAGGTSFEVSTLRDGRVQLASDLWIGEEMTGHLLGLPAVDVRSVGAGGGSIAWLDSEGLLHVGPASAGAEPGPVCYGRGGTEPTVTDAAVMLGFLAADRFLAGRMRLDRDAAHAAFERLAEPLGVDALEAASAVLALADQRMSDAIRELMVRQGIDAREALIVAGGGAIGLSIDRIAGELGCTGVLLPRAGASLTACGAAMCDLTRDFRRPHFTDSAAFDRAGVAAVLEDLEHAARGYLGSLDAPVADSRITAFVAARYAYQQWEIELPLPEARAGAALCDDLVEDFHRTHKRLFAVNEPGQTVEFVSWRVRALARLGAPSGAAQAAAPERDANGAGTRLAYFRGSGWLDVPVRPGSSMTSSMRVEGPLIVEQPTTTIVVQPRSTIDVLDSGDFLLRPAL
jgi:N-methylhydantoinase A